MLESFIHRITGLIGKQIQVKMDYCWMPQEIVFPHLNRLILYIQIWQDNENKKQRLPSSCETIQEAGSLCSKFMKMQQMLSIKWATLFTITRNVFNKSWHLATFARFVFCYNPDVCAGLQTCFLRSVQFLGHSWLSFAYSRGFFNVFRWKPWEISMCFIRSGQQQAK